jgi:hypothetical protein
MSLGWSLLTLFVWASLMFLPASTVIHAGSYACVLQLLLCLAFALWLASPAAFGVAALLGLVDFAWIWIPANPTRVTPVHYGAAALAVMSCVAIAMIVKATVRRAPPSPV